MTEKTDIEQLSRLIALPYRPQAARWETAAQGTAGAIGPSDWDLTAVLQFSAEDLDAIMREFLNVAPYNHNLERLRTFRSAGKSEPVSSGSARLMEIQNIRRNEKGKLSRAT